MCFLLFFKMHENWFTMVFLGLVRFNCCNFIKTNTKKNMVAKYVKNAWIKIKV